MNKNPLEWSCVWDIPLDATPRELADAVDVLWEHGIVERDIAFSIACGLYWHCAEWHGGQGSERYSILSTLEYKPGASESGPEDEDEAYVYKILNRNAQLENRKVGTDDQ